MPRRRNPTTQTQQIVALREVGLKQARIALLVGASVAAVKQSLYRHRKRQVRIAALSYPLPCSSDTLRNNDYQTTASGSRE